MKETKFLVKTTKSELEQIINEGIWDSLKYHVGKWGSLEKGGKLTGKDKYVAKARAQFDHTLTKAANIQVKKLVDELKDEFSEFPNMKDKFEFLNATSAIAQFYDSLAAAVDKYNTKLPAKEQEEGAMAPEVANGMVEALRKYVRTVLDVELSDVYKHFTEEEELEGKLLEQEEEVEPEDVLKTKEKSGTWKSLESNLLPGALGLLGGGFTAAHMALAQMYSGPQAGEIAEEIWKLEKQQAPDEAYEELAQRAMPDVDLKADGGYLRMVTPPGGNPANFAQNIDHWAEKTGRNPSDVIRMIAGQNPNADFPLEMSDDAGQVLYDYSKQYPNKIWGAIGNSSTPPSSHFLNYVKSNTDLDPKMARAFAQPGSMSGSPRAAATLLGVAPGGLSIPGVVKVVAQILKKQGATTIKKTLVKQGAGGMAAALGGTKAGAILAGSGILGTLGIGLGAAAAAIKLIRMKGKKSSRAQVLNDLEGTLKDFEGGGVLEKPDTDTGEDTTGEDTTTGDATTGR